MVQQQPALRKLFQTLGALRTYGKERVVVYYFVYSFYGGLLRAFKEHIFWKGEPHMDVRVPVRVSVLSSVTQSWLKKSRSGGVGAF